MEFRVWVTLVSSSAARLLVVGLVDRGYTVSPLNGAPGSDQPVFQEGPISTLAVLGLAHSKLLDYEEDEGEEEQEEEGQADYQDDEAEELALIHHGNVMAQMVTKDVKEVLVGLGASWHSIVVQEREGSCDWVKGQNHGPAQADTVKPNRFEVIG